VLRVLLFWSGGKDAAWTLYRLEQDDTVEVVALVTTFDAKTDRSAMHSVRRSLLNLQAFAAGLPLIEIGLPWPCSNTIYERVINSVIMKSRDDLDIHALAFGDIFLEDIRSYREQKFAELGLHLLFPIWGMPTKDLALEMIGNNLRARVACVDSNALPAEFAGREFDLEFLEALPKGVDPCGENGEFHSFVWSGPMLKKPIPIKNGATEKRDSFIYTDFLPDD
tara:strand:+ start:185 stop:853 length:669 start_codon:yes stop_codon:yes gene_type:complete